MDEDCCAHLEWLGEYAKKAGCRIHAYVLMTNHVHLLLTSGRASAPGELMKALGQRYVQYINRTYQTLWEGRFKSSLIHEDLYLLLCQRYIELNPVKATMVDHPGEYCWSSYRANAQGEASAVITPHPLYDALGCDAVARQDAYRELFRYALEPGFVDKIRLATNGNFALGNDRFTQQVSAALGRRVISGRPVRPGRPRREKDTESQDLFGSR